MDDIENGKKWTIHHGDRFSSAVLLVFGLYLVYEALQMRFGSVARPGPGFYPTLLAVLLVAVSGVLLVRSLSRREERLQVDFGARTGHIGITIAAIALYAAVLEAVGFLLCTFVLVFMLLVGIGKVPWLRSLVLASGGTALFYVIFSWIGIALPDGVLGF